MKRGDIVVLNLGNNIGKPRPALIIQADLLNESRVLTTTIVIPLTSTLLNMEFMRYTIEPTATNGLTKTSEVMIDKISQVKKSMVHAVIGHITKKQLDEIEARLLAVLGVR